MSRQSLALSLCIALLGGCAIQSGESSSGEATQKAGSELSTDALSPEELPSSESSDQANPGPRQERASESSPDKPSPDPWRVVRRVTGPPVDPEIGTSGNVDKFGK